MIQNYTSRHSYPGREVCVFGGKYKPKLSLCVSVCVCGGGGSSGFSDPVRDESRGIVSPSKTFQEKENLNRLVNCKKKKKKNLLRTQLLCTSAMSSYGSCWKI